MLSLLKSYRADGSSRAVWSDAVADAFRDLGTIPERASRVEAIREGPRRGLFHVDFSLLADLTGDDRFRVCLATPFKSYTEAVRAEVRWVERNFVLG